jgi:hypothetical protein
MDVTFHRLDSGRYFSTAVRDDGVTVSIPGYDRTSPIPHDLAHFVGERELGLTRGVWGTVAAGGMFTNMTVLSGRRRPHAAEHGRLLVKANAEIIGQAETVAAALHRAVHEGLGAAAALDLIRVPWRAFGSGPLPVSETDLRRAIGELRAAADRWAAVPVGQGMTLTWLLPVVRTPARAPRRERAGATARSGTGRPRRPRR